MRQNDSYPAYSWSYRSNCYDRHGDWSSPLFLNHKLDIHFPYCNSLIHNPGFAHELVQHDFYRLPFYSHRGLSNSVNNIFGLDLKQFADPKSRVDHNQNRIHKRYIIMCKQYLNLFFTKRLMNFRWSFFLIDRDIFCCNSCLWYRFVRHIRILKPSVILISDH